MGWRFILLMYSWFIDSNFSLAFSEHVATTWPRLPEFTMKNDRIIGVVNCHATHSKADNELKWCSGFCDLRICAFFIQIVRWTDVRHAWLSLFYWTDVKLRTKNALPTWFRQIVPFLWLCVYFYLAHRKCLYSFLWNGMSSLVECFSAAISNYHAVLITSWS